MEVQAEAVVEVQPLGSLAGIQQEDSKEAEEGFHSQPEAVQSLEEDSHALSDTIIFSMSIRVKGTMCKICHQLVMGVHMYSV